MKITTFDGEFTPLLWDGSIGGGAGLEDGAIGVRCVVIMVLLQMKSTSKRSFEQRSSHMHLWLRLSQCAKYLSSTNDKVHRFNFERTHCVVYVRETHWENLPNDHINCTQTETICLVSGAVWRGSHSDTGMHCNGTLLSKVRQWKYISARITLLRVFCLVCVWLLCIQSVAKGCVRIPQDHVLGNVDSGQSLVSCAEPPRRRPQQRHDRWHCTIQRIGSLYISGSFLRPTQTTCFSVC